MKDNFIRNTIILAVTAAVLLVVPGLLMDIPLLEDEFGDKVPLIDAYVAQILTLGGINAIMALSVNMVCGITGQLSLGQAGFQALGAYAVILLTTNCHVPLPVSIILGGLIAAIFGFLIGFPTLKLEGDYLAIVTLAFGEIIRIFLVNLKSITGGPNGMQFSTIFTTSLDHGPIISYTAIVGTLIVIIVLLQNFLRSTYGRAILAVREDEVAANANGIGVFKYKMIGFVIASFVAGIGGALYVSRIGFIKPDQASFTKSIDYLIFVVLGGMGSTTGAILAAYVLTFLQEVLRFLKDFRLLIYPVVLIIVMIFRPQGLLGTKEFSFEALFAFFKNFGKKGSKGVEKNVRK